MPAICAVVVLGKMAEGYIKAETTITAFQHLIQGSGLLTPP